MPFVICDLEAEDFRLVCEELTQRVLALQNKVEVLEEANRKLASLHDSYHETNNKLFCNQQHIRIELGTLLSAYINNRIDINKRLDQIDRQVDTLSALFQKLSL